MDGAVMVEPQLGRRPWVSAAVFEQGGRIAWGAQAINAAKDAVEGSFVTRQTCWGLELDTRERVVRIPERRILKGMYLFMRPAYEAGNRDLTLLGVQRARGTAQSWTPVHPALRTELRAMDVFLGPPSADGKAQCRLEGAAAQRAWEELWDAFEFLRLLGS